MAEKGFGVKEINLIGPSGTPTIESPNNLNLNANNVAISTNVSIGGTLTVTGNVSVGGTLTYEDVTNIDSVGLITARSGLIASGISTFSETVNFTRSGTAIDITQGELEIGGGIIRRDGKLRLWFYDAKDSWYYAGNVSNGAIGEHKFKVVNTDKFIISNTGVNVSGICTATTFSGSGASLTNVPAADPTDSDIQVAYTVTANGSSAYRFAGNGVVSTADNPDLYLIRGKKYRFINNSGGSHPFQIRVSDGGSAYSTGVTNNGASSGNIDFAPTFDSPSKLVYQCTNHGGMVGNIYISGGSSDIKMADQWRRTATLNTNNAENFITTDWARVSGGGLGTFVDNGGMTESGGIFTFPRTGIYLVTWQAYAETSSISRSNAVNIYVTTDNSSYNNRAASVFSMEYDMTSYIYGNGHCSAMIDVTDTSQVKVKFRVYSSGNVAWDVSSTQNRNCATFIRMGDT